MVEFEDRGGAKWHPRVTVSTLRRFEEATGLCLLRPGDWEKAACRIGTGTLLAYLACEAEARERGVTLEAFEEALEAPGCLEAAVRAAGEALADFSRRCGMAAANRAPARTNPDGRGPTSTASPPSPGQETRDHSPRAS